LWKAKTLEPEHAVIESGAVIGNRVTLKNGVQVWEGVSIEDDVFVGPNAVFTNDKWPRSPRSEMAGKRYQSRKWLEKTVIRKGVTIGANATISCGIEIGRYGMIGMGSVVTKSVPMFAIAFGSPAHVHGYACICGQKLVSERDILSCMQCGRSYKKVDGGLCQVEQV
jgi:UDP-2-acetamido-3-amino-2,3-dideoxy-glucuronate N-acetyltransferase